MSRIAHKDQEPTSGADKRPASARFGARMLTALVLALMILGTLAGVGLEGASSDFSLETQLWWAQVSGWLALAALLGSLSVSPLITIVARRRKALKRRLTGLRRLLGIGSAFLATLHLALCLPGYFGLTARADVASVWNTLWSTPGWRSGLVGLLILWVLTLTSYRRFIVAARIRLWKELHQMAHAAAFFGLLHLLFSPMASRRSVFWVAGTLGLLWLSRLGRLWKTRRPRPMHDVQTVPEQEPVSDPVDQL